MGEIVQGSPEWFAARLGKVTASRIGDVTGKTKSGYGAARAAYMVELIAERLSGQAADGFQSPAMRWGVENEPDARRAYEFRTDTDVVQVGFVPHPTIGLSGASPDGLVGDEGLLEIKAPNTATHIETLLSKQAPAKYLPQMDWQMACTGRAWCDFVSYDPRLPEDVRFFTCRVERSDERIAELEREVEAFLAELELKITQLKEAA